MVVHPAHTGGTLPGGPESIGEPTHPFPPQNVTCARGRFEEAAGTANGCTHPSPPEWLSAASGNGTACCPSIDEPPRVGNYFVSVYPPFSYWLPETAEVIPRLLAEPPATLLLHRRNPTAVCPDRRDAQGADCDSVQQEGAPLKGTPCAQIPRDVPYEASTIPNPLGLYLHVPFCTQRCHYCYYRSYSHRLDEECDEYLDALLLECATYSQLPAVANRPVSFLYVGGGTPSLLSAGQMRRLLRGLRSLFHCEIQEATFECAPNSVTDEKLTALREEGITRLSLGIQQLNDQVLLLNGRVHQVREVQRAYAAIQRIGFETVNVDLMVGMVGETDATFHCSLEEVISMQPDSITIYQLEIPRNTPLAGFLRAGKLPGTLPSWDLKRRRLAEAFARMEEAGYQPRSAYAAVRHPHVQFVYQDAQYRGGDLLGLGTSSFSYFSGVHYQNVTAMKDYLQRVAAGELPVHRAYSLSRDEQVIREFVLQLKLGGVDAAYFREKYGADIVARYADVLRSLETRGWLRWGSEGITLTREGLLRADSLLFAFYAPQHRDRSYW